jgi:RNA polymerase-binding protein DksA
MFLTDLPRRPVHTVRPSTTVAAAARLMCTRSVGALVVTDDSEQTVLGVITDRDLVWMVSEGLDPKIATVDEFIRGPLVTARVTDGLADVTAKMRAAGVRRLPVLDPENRLVGLVSLDDILVLLGREVSDVTAAITTELAHERAIGAGHEATKRDTAHRWAEGSTTATRQTVDRIRRTLLGRQRALFAGVDGMEEDLRLLEEDRPAERETRGQEESMVRLLDRVRERDRHQLEEIQRALAKIAAGAYGLCEGCRAPIDVGRLLATPEARRCVECERGLEAALPTPRRPFEPGTHRGVPADYRDLDDDELAEAVRERLRAHGDPDLLGVALRCHGGVVRLSGEIPSESQRQVILQLVADGMGLEVLDRLRVVGVDRERDWEAPPPEETPPAEERIPAGRGMRPLAPERWAVPEDEGEPPETAPDAPIPEKE